MRETKERGETGETVKDIHVHAHLVDYRQELFVTIYLGLALCIFLPNYLYVVRNYPVGSLSAPTRICIPIPP